MTWNVWWRFGGNWREREPGLVSVVAGQAPDVLGIQECWGTDGRTQAGVIAAAVGAESAFVPVGLPPIPDPPEDATQFGVMMGLGLVCRWPITAVERVALFSDGRDNAALVASVEHPRGELRVVVGATSWEPDRVDETARQVGMLQELTRENHATRAMPSLLLADLNYDRSQPALAGVDLDDAWDAADPGADVRTLSSTNRFAPPEAADQYDRRIDHILYVRGQLGGEASRAWIVRDEPSGFPPSDHYPVLADITVG